MENNLIFSIIGTFLIVFPLFFLGITHLLAYLSGWKKLASLYPDTNKKPEKTIRMTSAMFGLVSYRGVLNLGLSAEGLHLSTALFFKWANPPMCIPWEAIEEVRYIQNFLLSSYSLKVQGVKIRLLRKDLVIVEDLLKEKMVP